MLTTPAWPQPVITSSPLSLTSTISAWSSRTSGSASQPPPPPRLLRGKARFVASGAGNLAGHQHRAVEQEAGLAVLHHLKARTDEGPPARRRDLERVAARYRHPAAPPEVGMDEHGQVHCAQPPDQPVQARQVVEVAVAAHDDLDAGRVDVKAAHVLHDTV